LADLASREAAGETVTKKRKERSDKGAVKGPRKKPGANDGVTEEDDGQGDESASDDAVEGPSKKRKAAPKSKATPKGKATKGKATAKGNARHKATAKGKENRQSTKSRKSQLPSSNEFIGDTDVEDQML
jgi:hypothetical protein